MIKKQIMSWAQDFNETIQLEEWTTALQNNFKFLKSADLRENYYKMMYKWY